METLRMRDRSPKPRTVNEIVRDDAFAGWIMIAAGLVLIATAFLPIDAEQAISPLPGLALLAAGVTLNRFFRPRRDRRGSRSRRAIRRFVAMLFVALAVVLLWYPTFHAMLEGLRR